MEDEFRAKLTQLMIESEDIPPDAMLSDFFVIVRTVNMETMDSGMAFSMSPGNIHVLEGMMGFALRRIKEISDHMWKTSLEGEVGEEDVAPD